MAKGITTTAVAGLLVVLAILVPAAAAKAQPKANASDAAQLKTLQSERIEVLTRLVAHMMAQYRAGTSAISEVVSAENELTAARLDATEEPEKRVALLKEQLDSATLLLNVTEARFKVGQGSEADVCRARSLYLDVKIRLLRQRSGNKPPMPKPTGNQP